MRKGVKVILKNGDVEYYDPVKIPVDLRVEDGELTVEISSGYQHKHNLADVASYETYELCSMCGFELDNLNYCTNNSCILFAEI